MEHNSFITETDSMHVKRQSVTTLIITFVILSLLACLGFLIAWQTFLFFEAIVLISCFVALLQKDTQKHSYRLEFINDKLTITDINTNASFEVYDVTSSDFVITQTRREISMNYCSLAIKSTIFAFGGVKKCKELKEYIKNNFD